MTNNCVNHAVVNLSLQGVSGFEWILRHYPCLKSSIGKISRQCSMLTVPVRKFVSVLLSYWYLASLQWPILCLLYKSLMNSKR